MAAPLALLFWLVDWRAGLGLAAAVLTAIGIGAQRHLQALHQGGEEAREMREARGPLGLGLAHLTHSRARQRRLQGDRLAIGSARQGGVCRVPFGVSRGVHAIVTGATGSGKTATQAAILEAYVLAGRGAS